MTSTGQNSQTARTENSSYHKENWGPVTIQSKTNSVNSRGTNYLRQVMNSLGHYPLTPHVINTCFGADELTIHECFLHLLQTSMS